MECWLSLRGQHEAETHTPSGPWYEIKDGLRRPPTSDSLWACQHLSWGHCPHPLYPLPSCTLCTSPRGARGPSWGEVDHEGSTRGAPVPPAG